MQTRCSVGPEGVEPGRAGVEVTRMHTEGANGGPSSPVFSTPCPHRAHPQLHPSHPGGPFNSINIVTGSSIHGILQARVLEWGAIAF